MTTKIQIPVFTESDFSVFQIPGLENRMEALQKTIRPKFEAFGQIMAQNLTAQLGDEVFVHIAKHARRTVNPPDETWVAWATNKRGYKAHPHFQLGLCGTHLFAWFALIYECDKKQPFARKLQDHLQIWKQIPKSFYVSEDHTKQDIIPVQEITNVRIVEILDRLSKVKKAEFLCGLVIPAEEVATLSGEQLLGRLEETFEKLIPLYRFACQA
ncbi:Uncharacterized protein YktB, UPF0637 family [Thermoactinomyces sp. DSM 45891]|uniref:YktB family protein n=1 Tax=Thermoactinomyces sp. DSM 45891 TaxID=1761907 RepID=UPI00091C5048|nr:DUF1054 domain-containing protein [Thermoactinomyces sp. DSM 45891]SFX27582.1 Uncharacterized protein YktB, UPF0637 family [Thermoactinomyces sp. DSM 45891]